MISMQERVSNAIRDSFNSNDIDNEQLINITKAAILAMREPTKEMIKAGNIHGRSNDVYQAMIDAALKE